MTNYIELPMLESITLNNGALAGDNADERKAIDEEPFDYMNTLLMRSYSCISLLYADLPSLVSFKGENHHFNYIGTVVLESMCL